MHDKNLTTIIITITIISNQPSSLSFLLTYHSAGTGPTLTIVRAKKVALLFTLSRMMARHR
jgi:hypothetical protein